MTPTNKSRTQRGRGYHARAKCMGRYCHARAMCGSTLRGDMPGPETVGDTGGGEGRATAGEESRREVQSCRE